MKNNKQQIINEAYNNYCIEYWGLDDHDKITHGSSFYIHEADEYNFEPYNKRVFTDTIKTNKVFAEKWGLQITERELSEEERWRIRFDYYPKDKQFPWDRMALPSHRFLDDFNIPRRTITLTYKNETIESYE